MKACQHWLLGRTTKVDTIDLFIWHICLSNFRLSVVHCILLAWSFVLYRVAMFYMLNLLPIYVSLHSFVQLVLLCWRLMVGLHSNLLSSDTGRASFTGVSVLVETVCNKFSFLSSLIIVGLLSTLLVHAILTWGMQRPMKLIFCCTLMFAACLYHSVLFILLLLFFYITHAFYEIF